MNSKIRKVPMQKRLQTLGKWVEHCLDLDMTSNPIPIQIKYLFYDEYEESDKSFHPVDLSFVDQVMST